MLAERNPLHGRQSAEFVIQPLTYREAAGFVPRRSLEDRLRLFGVFGGMPYCLSLLDPTISAPTPELRRIAADDSSVVLLGTSDLVGARRRTR